MNATSVFQYTTRDGTPPAWSSNMTNSTKAGLTTNHSVIWSDNAGLSGYIFSFDNGNGTLYNDSWRTMTSDNWTNISKIINSTIGSTIRWQVYANDTSNLLNATSVFQYTTTSSTTIFGPEGFESGTQGSFDSFSVEFGSGSADIDGTSKITGTYTARFGATGECVAVAREDMEVNYTELYFQTKILLPTDFAFGASGYILPLKLQDSADADRITLYLYNDTGTIKLIISGDVDLGWVDTGISFSKNVVHQIEIYSKLDATTGRIKVWFDNNVEGSPDYDSGNLNSGTGTIRKIDLGNTYSAEAYADYIYMDDITANDAFIGAGTPPASSCAIQLIDGAYYVPQGCTCYYPGISMYLNISNFQCS
jgi:hypothetical protein